MAGRVVIGSAEYDLLVNIGPLREAFLQAEKEAAAAAGKIGSEAKRIEASLGGIKTRQTISLTLDTRGGEEAIRKVQARLAAVKDETVNLTVRGAGADQVLAKLKRDIAAVEQRGITLRVRQAETVGAPAPVGGSISGAIGGGLRGAVGVGAGFAGVTLGAQAVREAYDAVIDATVKAEQAQKALNIIYGDAAGIYQRIARDAAASSTATLSSTQAVVTQFATLRQNYGFTADQIEKLTKLTLQYAAVSGKDVVDVAQRLQSALRGEAEAAEQLGLTLNSDAVKAMAAMTAEQRKNFETLDQTTKAQIVYNELLRQSANVQKASVNNTNTLQGSQAALAKEGDNLAKALGERLTPATIAFNQAAAAAAKATADWLSGASNQGLRNQLLELEEILRRMPGTGNPSIPLTLGDVQRGIDQRNAARGIRRPAAGAEESEAARQARSARAAEEEGIKVIAEAEARKKEIREKAAQAEETAEKARLARRIKDVQENAKLFEEVTRNAIEQEREQIGQQIEAVEERRDKDIEAVRAAADAEVEALETRRQAAADYYASAIAGVEAQRDRDLAAIESRKQAALDALDAERRAVEAARRTEDRDIADRRERERSAIEANTAAVERAAEAERRGIEANRDAALKALDERSAAEDRRHSEAMANIDREEQAQLGIVDEELRKLDAAEERERRAETDRQQKQARADARRAVKEADTPEERARAQRQLADVERDIAREQRRRQRDDARAALRDRAEAIRKEFEQRKEAERQRHEQEQAAIEQEKQQIQERANQQLQALNDNLKAFQENQQALLKSLEDRYKEEDRKREDARRKEDESFDERKKAIERNAKEEADAVKGIADARIAELRKAAQSSDRYYAEEIRKARRNADDQIKEIRRVADEHVKALNRRLQNTVKALNLELKRHQEAADRLVEIWNRAIANIRGSVRIEITGVPGSSRPTDPTIEPPGGGGGRVGWFNPYTGQVVYTNGPAPGPVPPWQRTSLSGGTGSRQPSPRAFGGDVRSGQAYWVGERRRPELFVPQQDGRIYTQEQVMASMSEPSLLSAGYAAGARAGWDGAASGPTYNTSRASSVGPITVNVDARGVAGIEQAGDLIAAKAAQQVVRMLDRTERMHAAAVDPLLGGAR